MIKNKMDKKLIVEYSGWVELIPEKVNFTYIGTEEKSDITGVEYMKLGEKEKSDYILESLSQAIDNGYDGEISDLNILMENPI